MKKKDYEILRKNWLYQYAECITANRYFRFKEIKKETKSLIEKDRYKETADAVKRDVSLYLIYFVYRYILECETLEEALEQEHEKILEIFKLKILLIRKYIFIGGGTYKITLTGNYDIAIILEILYNDCNYEEQIRAVLNNCIMLKNTTDNKLYNNAYRLRQRIIADRIEKCEKLLELKQYYREHRKEIHL